MDYLVFQLQAPLSCWGEAAVGEYRGTADYPTQSALIGLLGAALRLRRSDEAAHAQLRDGYGFAVALLSAGTLLRDYHTAQVPPRAALKGRPHATRRYEMAALELGTILSSRDYRQNAFSLVAIQSRTTNAPAHALTELVRALRQPKFTLYLGRKSCPPSAPLWPQLIETESAYAAFAAYRTLYDRARQVAAGNRDRLPLEEFPPVTRIVFDDYIHAGIAGDVSTRRKDRLIRRRGWQFGDREEHVALVHQGGPDEGAPRDPTCISA